MLDRVFLAEYLEQYFDEVEAMEFYRDIFPIGSLASHSEKEVVGKYNAIAVELLPEQNKGHNARRYVLTDELDYLEKLLKSDNFIIISPISYAGRSREAKNARFIYGLAIDLDGVETIQNITDLFYQIDNEVLPKPSYVVWSGTGLHLYYNFEKPIPCFNNIIKQLAELKNALTKKIWNRYITVLYDKPQIQSLFQGFRMCNGITKGGNRTRAFRTGSTIDLDYLNSFVDSKSQVKEFAYKSNLTVKEAAAKYPEWYEKRIINKQPKGTWQCKTDLYNWWLNRLKNEILAGHRYYGIMCLSIYAKKSGVSREQLETDAYGLVEAMERLTTDENNHFTRADVMAALEMYNDNYITFPIDSITQLTAIPIEKNKRNYKKQEWHLQDIRSIKKNMKDRGQPFKNPEGRPNKEKEVMFWRQHHPDGTKAECIKDLKLSKNTVYKYWG